MHRSQIVGANKECVNIFGVLNSLVLGFGNFPTGKIDDMQMTN